MYQKVFKIGSNEATSKPQVNSCTTELDLSEKLEVLILVFVQSNGFQTTPKPLKLLYQNSHFSNYRNIDTKLLSRYIELSLLSPSTILEQNVHKTSLNCYHSKTFVKL